ncbi:hypothetical protein ASE48_08465 [Mycobacterium sp. Root265]|nr:hypothetical protein ASE48_08465 [Mycobacterium sp. Root265]
MQPPGRIGAGITPKELSLESTRQFAQAVDDILTKYPFVKLKALRGEYYPVRGEETSSYAHASGVFSIHGDGIGHYVAINAPLASDADRARAASASKRSYYDNKYAQYNDDYAARPVYYTMIHEMGHVMDINGKGGSQRKIEAALESKFRTSPEYADMIDDLWSGNNPTPGQFRQQYNKWMSTKLVSAYSYENSDRDKGPYIVEAIAEAFADVEMRGDKAEAMSKLIHQLVLAEAKKVKGVT